MMSEEKETRVNRHKKSNQSPLIKKLSIGLVVVAALILGFEFLFGGSDKDSGQFGQNGDNQSFVIPPKDSSSSHLDDSSDEEESDQEETASDEEEESHDEEEASSESVDDSEINEVPSDDSNVIQAYVGTWEPVGTQQSEPHVTQFDETSVDWAEMKEASAQATGVSVANMVVNWIGNNGEQGEQKVTVTFTDSTSGQIYKVYLSWVANEGWQPTRYEELKAIS